jgi:hypothetical protein
MSNEALYKAGLQSLSAGVALIDPDGWRIRFENARFF